jgi:hypothetical protein
MRAAQRSLQRLDFPAAKNARERAALEFGEYSVSRSLSLPVFSLSREALPLNPPLPPLLHSMSLASSSQLSAHLLSCCPCVQNCQKRPRRMYHARCPAISTNGRCCWLSMEQSPQRRRTRVGACMCTGKPSGSPTKPSESACVNISAPTEKQYKRRDS